jgi:hypothetical protein
MQSNKASHLSSGLSPQNWCSKFGKTGGCHDTSDNQFCNYSSNRSTESTINMESNTPQTAHDGRFSIRSAFDCHLAHICFEAWEAYLKTYKPLFGDREGYPIIYANLEKDAIHFAHFEMWHLQAFARSIDPTQIRELILQYNTTTESAFIAPCSSGHSRDILLNSKAQGDHFCTPCGTRIWRQKSRSGHQNKISIQQPEPMGASIDQNQTKL